jgi:hypothetical protein
VLSATSYLSGQTGCTPGSSLNRRAGAIFNSVPIPSGKMSFEDDLSAVEEHVAEARRMVQRQKGLIVRLGAAGVSTLDAQRILWLLESNGRRLENHRDFLKANFSSVSDDQHAT